MPQVQTCYESAAVWSDAAAMPDSESPVAPRRGQVWLAETPGSRRGLVVVIAPDADHGRVAIVAPVTPGAAAGRGRVTLHDEGGLSGGGAVQVGRLTAVHRGELIAMVSTLARQRLDEIDAALRDVLGIGAPAAPPSPPQLRRDPPLQEFLPPPPPSERLASPQQVPPWPPTSESTRLEDHPMARLFGQSSPALPPSGHSGTDPAAVPAIAPVPAASGIAPVPAGSGIAPVPASSGIAPVLPALLEVVRQRLHRSSPHLEGLLVQAAGEGRSIEWTTAAVRRASVRGVMQSTLDDLAAEMETAAARGRAAV